MSNKSIVADIQKRWEQCDDMAVLKMAYSYGWEMGIELGAMVK